MGVCEILAATDYPGLTWSEIEGLLPLTGVRDAGDPNLSKRKRLYAVLLTTQYTQRAGNCVIAFINQAMKPARYVNDPARFGALRDGLNEVLAFKALRVTEAGRSGQWSGRQNAFRGRRDCRTAQKRAGAAAGACGSNQVLQRGADQKIGLSRHV